MMCLAHAVYHTHSHVTFLQCRIGIPPLLSRLMNLTPRLDCCLLSRSTTSVPVPKRRRWPSTGFLATLMPTAPPSRTTPRLPKLQARAPTVGQKGVWCSGEFFRRFMVEVPVFIVHALCCLDKKPRLDWKGTEKIRKCHTHVSKQTTLNVECVNRQVLLAVLHYCCCCTRSSNRFPITPRYIWIGDDILPVLSPKLQCSWNAHTSIFLKLNGDGMIGDW